MAMEPPSEKQKIPTTNIQTQTETVTVSVNGSPSKVSLSLSNEPGTRGGELRWHLSDHGKSRGERSLDFDRDVLGVEIEIKRIVVKTFEIAQKESRLNCLGEKKRIRRDYIFEMETKEMVTLWGRLISDCMNSLGRPQVLFVIVNPFGGNKNGPKIFENEVKPLLEAAGINFKMQETRYRLHAREIAYSLDFTKYDGLVTVSGDGVLAEVVNGLLKREDWERAIKMPLGIIPGGCTGNGMVKSLLHPVGDHYSASNATFAIIRGHKCSLDVASIVQGEKMVFSVLLLTWGLVADIDIESEKLRWMGNARIEIYSLLRIFGLRRYNGKIRFVPAPGYEQYGEPVREPDGSKGENGDRSKLHCYQGASTEFEASKWRFIDGPFVTVWIHNVPWASKDVMAAPKAQFSDGCLDLVIVRDCPKTVLLSLLLSIRDGSHVNSPFVTYLKVKALQLEPGRRVGDSAMRGIIDMDGEVIARGDDATNQDPNLMDYGSPFLMKLDQGLATLFCPI
ncbi:sphingosine kinase 1-like isoform X1 [Carex littledalei]|uniref:Sphingosine kinase 1-like isoform X1 n=1 Tax=Carex littledalei TaxID=544730 RepID=A0A833R3Z8_9POAL|nr:sphingosine kinase 1-like isoform X1 [Carex littledalei]